MAGPPWLAVASGEWSRAGGRERHRWASREAAVSGSAWARLQSEEPGWPQDPLDAEFQNVLLGWLRFHRAMLIGELVPQAYRYLRDNPACDARSAFDYVLVDEYQDLNRAEQELLDLLAANGEAAVVGDVDQSIYRFRHANPEGIEEYADTHPHTHDENLDECRRCPKRVVAIADRLIRHNHPGEPEPRLRPMPTNTEGELHIVQWPTIEEEVAGLGDYVTWLIHQRNYLPREILVLTPRRRIGYRIRDHIAGAGEPVHSFYHEEALEDEEAQCAFAVLTLLTNNEDRVALRWWLGHGTSTERVGPYRRLRKHCEETGQSPWQALAGLAAANFSLLKLVLLSKGSTNSEQSWKSSRTRSLTKSSIFCCRTAQMQRGFCVKPRF